MEQYSPRMEAAVREQLRQATAAELAQLLAYFQCRKGPGLSLVEAELQARASCQQPALTLISTPATYCLICGAVKPARERVEAELARRA